MRNRKHIASHSAVPVSRGAGDSRVPPNGNGRYWRIYYLRRREDGRGYVGVTCRTPPARFRGHCTDALRDGGMRGRPGTVTHALRETIRSGADPAVAFQILEVARYTEPEAARRAEANWIRVLGTAQPNGFNVMPGGASLGSIANAKPVAIRHPTRGRLSFPALSAAIALREQELKRAGRQVLSPSLVYWRVASGWKLEEALGYRPHADGRGLRQPLRRGRRPCSLREAAATIGVTPDALRSRVHRARRAGLRRIDLAVDRRGRGAPRAARRPVRLPDPRRPEALPLNTTRFAAATGIPKATVIHRLTRLRAGGRDPEAMSRSELLAAIQQRTERRIIVELAAPDGPVLRGGVRELVRAVLGDPKLKWGRHEQLGASAIRARLRRLPGWRDRLPPDRDQVLWAFGFRPETPAESVREQPGEHHQRPR